MIDVPAAEPGGSETGYSHHAYAESLAEFGAPRFLPQSGGSVLERAIPGTQARDAMGCYPLFSCRDWAALRQDCDSLGSDLVSLAVVTDPFGKYDEALLREAFPDLVRPFKTHFVADLEQAPDTFVSKHHRYYARRALEKVLVELCPAPATMLDDWCALYDNLVQRHSLTGIKAFSRPSFALQLAVPGLTMFRATHAGVTVAAQLWFLQEEVAYSHLAAANSRGYELMAAYALYSHALEYFAGRARFVAWGGGAGLDEGGRDGLAQFKRGWSNTTRTSFFCGRIFNRAAYDEICAAKGLRGEGYFPAYRFGEFQ